MLFVDQVGERLAAATGQVGVALGDAENILKTAFVDRVLLAVQLECATVQFGLADALDLRQELNFFFEFWLEAHGVHA